MKTILIWKRGMFKNIYEIYSNNSLIGRLKGNTWSSSAEGEINNKKYHFKTKGFLKQNTQILDPENGFVIGTIVYNTWMTKASIEFTNGIANWKYDNIWNTKFSVIDKEGNQIRYHGSSLNGSIEFDNQNDLLTLTGLYLTNYYWQMSVILIVCLLPIWITMF